MRTLLTSYPLLIFLAALVALLYPSCQPADPVIEELPATAAITLDFSDPNTKPDQTGGYRYLYEGESYLATENAWLQYNCPTSPQFFAAYNDVNRTVWLAHCVEGIHLGTLTLSVDGTNPLPSPVLGEITGGQEETFEVQIPDPLLQQIDAGATQLILSFSYQND